MQISWKLKNIAVQLFHLACVAGFLYACFVFASRVSFRDAKGTEAPKSVSLAPKVKAEQIKLGWKKGSYIVPTESWQTHSHQAPLKSGQTYLLVQSYGAREKCLLGPFELQYLSDSKLVFSGSRSGTASKMERYSVIKEIPLKIEVFGREEIYAETTLSSCRDWLEISL